MFPWIFVIRIKKIDQVKSTKFLGMHTDNYMNWKNHVEQILPKLSAACFSIRSLIHTLNLDSLGMVYFACFHSALQYGIIFWGNSTHAHQICAAKLKLKEKNVIILCVYREPSGNFDCFLKTIDSILNSLCNRKMKFIINGDINYLETNNKKQQLDNLPVIKANQITYNFRSTVHFPTRIVNNSISIIDNIFIDNKSNYTIQPCINGLSDHDAQLPTLNNFSLQTNNDEPNYTRNINNKNNIAEFQLQLSWGQCDNIFGNNDVNTIFNIFLNTSENLRLQFCKKRN